MADEADEQRCQEEAAHAAALADMALTKERRCHELATLAAMVAEKAITQLAAMLAEMASTVEQRCHDAATQEKELADEANKQRRHKAAAQEKALADDAKVQRCQESAARAAALAEPVSAMEQSCQELVVRPTVLAETTLADERHCQKEADCGVMLGETALAAERRRSLLAALAEESALAMARVTVSADSSLPEPVLAEKKRHQEETAKKQCHADDERNVLVPVLPPDPGNLAIRRIWVKCALLAAPLDAILAKIECDDIAHKAQTLPTTTSPHPVAMLSTPPRPMTYVGAVLSTMGGSTCATSLALALAAIPLPIVDGQLQTVHQRA